ncbi:MAG: autotransporter outer membrane beta-barrel domain-containing protein [Candidatus Omnitrophota bacterium]
MADRLPFTALTITRAPPFFVTAAGSFGWNKYNGKRNINIGSTIKRTTNADYSGRQYGAYIGGGYDIKGYSSATLTPLVSLQYSHLNLDSYTETGADALNLSVKKQGYDTLQSGLGVRTEYPIEFKNFTLTSEVHGKWLYDFFGDEVTMTSTFTGGGASFEAKGYKPAQSSFDVGTKLLLAHKQDLSLTAEYDVEVKEDFVGQHGAVTVRYNF